MASNTGSGSVNPTTNHHSVSIAATINTTGSTLTSIPVARSVEESTIETEPQSVHRAKRRRTASVNGNRKDSNAQADSARDDTNSTTGSTSNTAAANVVHLQTQQYATHPVIGTSTNYAPAELHHQQLQQQQQSQLEVTQQNHNPFLQSQLDSIYGLMMANQLQQATAGGTVPYLSIPPVPSNNELQNLTALLQQHLYGATLAQTLGIHLPSYSAAAANHQTFAVQPSSQIHLQGFHVNPDTFPVTLQASTAVGHNIVHQEAPSSSSHIRSNEMLTQSNHSVDHAPAPNDSSSSSGVSGRPPIQLYISCDDDSLSEYQCLVRKQIELFEAGVEDVESNAQGRNRPIVLGQVGIRCRHCTMLPPRHRSRGAIYYPAKLQGIYQAAQNLAVAHLGEHCQNVPDDVRATLSKLRERKSSAGGGKRYWANGVRVLGVCEDRDGLRFESRITPNDGAIL